VRLVVAGKEEPPADLRKIEVFINDHGLQDKVTLVPRFITDEEKAAFYRRALACAYIPYDEDSYGYVTLEAFECRKPLLTCSDSGGIQILVKQGRTGFVVEPEPQAIAAALDQLYEERALTMQMGEAGHRLMRELRIDWDHVIQSLTT
jgi:glycosyltransferase involved in cell wall biosynthesis